MAPMGQAVRDEGSARGRVLLIEDDDAIRHGMAAALRARHFDVVEAERCEVALRLATSRPDAIVTDLRLPDGDAVELLPKLRSIDAGIPVYIVTGFATIDVAVRAVKLGAEEMFTKPVDLNDLAVHLDRGIARRRATASTMRRKFNFADTGWRSDAMRRLEDEIERLRTSDCTVLVLGETGTGKSVLARRIHEASPRRGGPFIDVNCAGLSREFFESELFGHERGAFTGAHAPKQGLFDAADGGTLFLDEIGDIDLQVQPKILKVLEEKRFRRMGGLRERDVDVRLVAATHHDLLGAVEQRTFRADLFYRISTVTIRVPSLRERPEDLPVLVQTLIAGTGRSEVTLSPAAWEKMHASSWPGNIRELKNVIHRALLLRSSDTIEEGDIRFDGSSSSLSRLEVAVAADGGAPRTLDEAERQLIMDALAAEGGRVADAARRLGIPRSTLYQKIKNHGLPLTGRARRGAPPSERGP